MIPVGIDIEAVVAAGSRAEFLIDRKGQQGCFESDQTRLAFVRHQVEDGGGAKFDVYQSDLGVDRAFAGGKRGDAALRDGMRIADQAGGQVDIDVLSVRTVTRGRGLAGPGFELEVDPDIWVPPAWVDVAGRKRGYWGISGCRAGSERSPSRPAIRRTPPATRAADDAAPVDPDHLTLTVPGSSDAPERGQRLAHLRVLFMS